MLKNPLANAGDRFNPWMGKEIATHSRILAWKIPRTEEPVGLCDHGVTKGRTQLSD